MLSVRRNLRRDTVYWDRELGRSRIAKARHSTQSEFPWWGPVPRPLEDLVDRDTGGPSPHLTWAELACKDGTPYPAEWRTNRATRLAREFEKIRMLCGNRPITVTSAFRSTAWNFEVGGAETSQHVFGRALDLAPPRGMTIDEFWNVIYAYARSGESNIRGLGRYAGWVHVDIRPVGKLLMWVGKPGRDRA